MKKFLIIVLTIFMLVGCDMVMNNPTKRVENFLNKYQVLDEEVLRQLDTTLNNEEDLTNKQREDYKEVMKKQYKDLTYTIKDEEVNGNIATVKVEIKVYDFNKAMLTADQYLIENPNIFNDETGNVNNELFMDYKIEQMKNTKDTVKYTLEFTLTKSNDKWQLNNVDEVTRQKIHGIYQY